MRDSVESQELQDCNNLCQVRRTVAVKPELSHKTIFLMVFLMLGFFFSVFPLLSPEPAGKDAWSWVPLVQTAHGCARVCRRLHHSRHQIPRLLRRSVRVLFYSVLITNLHLYGRTLQRLFPLTLFGRGCLWCVCCVFQIPPQPGICATQGSQPHLSRPGEK